MEEIKIIIADDNKCNAELTKNYIEKNSEFKILDIATSSKEEIEMINKYNPDLIFTDIIRKGEDISGLDIILDSLKNGKKEKYILMTASTKTEILYKNNYKMPSNVVGYLKKPFDFKELIEELNKAVMVMCNCTGGLSQDYYILPLINLEYELTDEEMVILEKLDNKIESKIYTHHEYDIVKQKLCFFYYEEEEEDEEEEKDFKYSVEDKDVSKEEFRKLWKKIDEIDKKYIYK